MHISVAGALGRRIAGHDLPSGGVLSLADIEAEYGVSRTVAREAMRRLETLGMLRARRRVGLTVTEVSQWNLLDPEVITWRLDGPERGPQLRALTDLRIAIEPTAARLAASYADADERATLARLAHELRDLGNRSLGASEEYLATDVRYHQLLLRASRNELLAGLDVVVEAVLVGRTRLGISPQQPVAAVLDYHELTARAIAERMADAAESYCRAMVTGVRRELTDSAVDDPYAVPTQWGPA